MFWNNGAFNTMGLGRTQARTTYCQHSGSKISRKLYVQVELTWGAGHAEAVMDIPGRSAREIFGDPDDRKLHSCATLFALVSPANSVFEALIDRYYTGERDLQTLELLGLTD